MRALDEFNALDEYGKTAALSQARFLADREENGLTVQLYSLDSFYVEVFRDIHASKTLRTRAFKNNELLVPYLAHIKFNLR